MGPPAPHGLRGKEGDVGLGAAPELGAAREGSAPPVPLDRHLQTHTEKGNRNLIKDTERERLRVWGQPRPHRCLGSPRAPCKQPGRLAPWGRAAGSPSLGT